MDGMVGVVPVANGLFEQFDGWDLNHMLGEVGAELQAECTDENRILHQECLHGKDGTDRRLPDYMTTGRLGMPMDGRQKRLALIVGGMIVHAHLSQQYGCGDGDVPTSRLGPCT